MDSLRSAADTTREEGSAEQSQLKFSLDEVQSQLNVPLESCHETKKKQ